MWCDESDMDLPRVIPNAEAICAPVRDLKLRTVGGFTGGKLNHPSVWNGDHSMLAFFALGEVGADPQPLGYYSGEPIVSCTAWKAFRDAWPHGYTMLLRQDDSDGSTHFVPIWDTCALHRRFERLMYNLRDWQKLSDEELRADVGVVELTLQDAVARLQSLIGR